jgi:hypothetical protein
MNIERPSSLTADLQPQIPVATFLRNLATVVEDQAKAEVDQRPNWAKDKILRYSTSLRILFHSINN